jgi:type IX secretion system PorP/SprF family membrane protein
VDKRRRYYNLCAVFIMIASFAVHSLAQQEAMNAQFILNTLTVNPGYTGYKEVQSFTIDHRSQWVGFKGAPTTNNLSFDMALPRNKEMAFGGTIMHDNIGPTSELSLSGNVAYRFYVNRNAQLSFGLKGYVGLFQANFTGLELASGRFGQEDINFSYDASSELILNFGAGAYYHSEDYFIGISSPRLFKNRIDNNNLETYNTIRGRTAPTYYFMGGYNFHCNMWLDFQPAILTKTTMGAPLSVGLYGSFLMRSKWRLGGFYTIAEAGGVMLQMQVSEKLKVGYSFDVAANALISTNLGSHEIGITYDMKTFSKRMVYPRRF